MEPRLKELVARYNRSGPRYTSYPTAPQWQSTIGARHYIEQLQAPGATPYLSLYVHIPFCKEICHFCGCSTFQLKGSNYADRYLDYLLREIALVANYLPSPRQVNQMHWGGGTPTFLNEAQIERLVSAIKQHFTFTADAEVAIELDPRVTSESQTRLLRQLGFNRVSFGVQDNDPAVQAASNRIQPMAVTRALYDLCRQLNFESINFDLIYGLPKQTPASFAATLNDVLDCRPDRVALFSYAHVPWLKPFQRKINATDLPEAETKMETFLMSRQRFISAGYETIGMDHFALPGDELSRAKHALALRRNFQGYTVKPESRVIALGASSISDLGNLYVQNSKKFNVYFEALDHGNFAIERGYQLTENDQLRRRIIMELMCNFHLPITKLEEQFNIHFAERFVTEIKELKPMVDDGLLIMSRDTLKVTELGQLLVRNIAMIFDDHLSVNAQTTPIYSKTV